MIGFGSDIRAILRSAVKRHASNPPSSSSSGSGGGSSRSSHTTKDESIASHDNTGSSTGTPPLPLAPAQLIMSTATLTKAVRALLQDVQGDKGSGFLIDYNDPTNLTPKKRSSPSPGPGPGAGVKAGTESDVNSGYVKMNVVEVWGLLLLLCFCLYFPLSSSSYTPPPPLCRCCLSLRWMVSIVRYPTIVMWQKRPRGWTN